MTKARGHIASKSYLEFWSRDNRLGVRLSTSELDQMLKICEKAFPKETGGLLIGHYTSSLDCAIITKIYGPPDDSRAGRTWFSRGVQGLKAILSNYWKEGDYYLGEWHAHPRGASTPSETDRSQMNLIARTKDFECREPLLILVGGTPKNYQTRLMVFRVGANQEIELFQSPTPTP